jgi:hypothetical protein
MNKQPPPHNPILDKVKTLVKDGELDFKNMADALVEEEEQDNSQLFKTQPKTYWGLDVIEV